MKQFIQTLAVMAALFVIPAEAQPRYNMQQLKRERLDRGVLALRQEGRVVVSWRLLSTDRIDEPFDVYRNGRKLNAQPLTTGGTFFVDGQPLQEAATYEVRGGGKDGRWTLAADAPNGYLPVKISRPAGGTTPDGESYTYSANDASVADVDGDGQLEIILKWDPSNAHDNAHDGYTGPTIFDCYKIVNGPTTTSRLLWRIDMGINIRSGAHYVPYIVYDLDGDGRAEFIVRTADGTRDGKGRVIGDSTADYRHRPATDARNPNPEKEWAKYNRKGRPMTGRILTGPEYLTVFNGLTGEAMDTKPYIPERGNLMGWGDDYANRSDRMLAAVGYLDGVHASAIFCRGYYTRTVLAAWDWDGRELKQHWVFDTNQPAWATYAGQGNHNLRVADVDGDGSDEITYGSMAVDHDGRGIYNTGMGHGDAIHLMPFSPDNDELQVWDCHENKRDGSDFRQARTGEVIFQIPSTSDVGRCMAADIDPTNPGVEMWSTDSHGIRNLRGEVLYDASDPSDPQHQQHLVLGGRHLSVNFGIWWDGDLLRELLDHETISKYDWQQHTIVDLKKLDGVVFNNWTKSNPCLSADLFGDWREEVIARTLDSDELRIFSTPIPTDYRITCLMEDVPYRLSVAMQNVGYNQPPETGFYLGHGMKTTGYRSAAGEEPVVDNTPDSIAKALTYRPVPGSTRKGTHPVLFLIGNSTMRNGTKGNGNNGQWGWGYYASRYFDGRRITVENQALGGMSTRTFYTDLWPAVREALKPGDWVIVSIGHNDTADFFDQKRARGVIPGVDPDTMVVGYNLRRACQDTVYSYGTYLRRYVAEIRAKGAHPVLMSLTPRDARDAQGKIVRKPQTQWAVYVAAEEGVPFVDLNDLSGRRLDSFSLWKQQYHFYGDRIHTSQFGAELNARSAAEGLYRSANPQLRPLQAMMQQVEPPVADVRREAGKPVVFITGDSTVKNEDSDEHGMWGWGSQAGLVFDTTKITISNQAKAGRSTRTFLREGRWDRVYHALQPGDFVLIQFGHNDIGDITDAKGRAVIRSAKDTCHVYQMPDGRYELVYSFGWYLKKFIDDVREKGATPILLSLTPRNEWPDGRIERRNDTYGQWYREVAAETGVELVDVHNITADFLDRKFASRDGQKSKARAAKYYCRDHTHTSKLGAQQNARSVAQGLRTNHSPLADYLKR